MMSENELRAALVQHLRKQELDNSVSNFLADVLLDNCLSWKTAPFNKTQEIDGIVAFAFGNRVDDQGNRSPGPINEQLAETVVRYYSIFRANNKCKVWAQWEIALKISEDAIPPNDLIVINPIHDLTTGRTKYLSTKGVLEQVAQQLPEGKTVFVIAHRDHLWRCVNFTEKFRYRVVTAQDDMPSAYDTDSGQLWTTSRDRYILSDIITRLNTLRSERN